MTMMLKNKTFKFVLKVSLLVGLILLIKDQNGVFKKGTPMSESKILMDTIVKFDLCDDGHSMQQMKNAFDEAWKKFYDLESKLNAYDQKSELSKINDSFPDPIFVSSDSYRLIEASVNYYEKTNGAFNICVGPLIRMWKEAKKNNKIQANRII